MTTKFRYYKGVRYVAPHKPAPPTFMRCGSCGRAWDDDKPTSLTPTPSGRCPFEYWHKAERARPRHATSSDDADLVTFVAETLRDTRRALVELVERAEAAGDIDGLPEYEQARKAIDEAGEALRQAGV